MTRTTRGMDIYARIARHLRSSKDVAVFGSLSTTTMRAVDEAIPTTLTLTMHSKARDNGMDMWIERHGHVVKTLVCKRSVFSPSFNLPRSLDNVHNLTFLWCRVFPHLSLPHSLRSLTLHQLRPCDIDANPGDVTNMLRHLVDLKDISITFSRDWGIVSFGPLDHDFRRIELTVVDGKLLYYGTLPDSLEELTLRASFVHLPTDTRIPGSCRLVNLRMPESELDCETLFGASTYPHLVTLHLECLGLVYPLFTDKMHLLETFSCRSGSFIIRRMPTTLHTLDVDVVLGFVCEHMSQRERESFWSIPIVRCTQNQCTFFLEQFLL